MCGENAVEESREDARRGSSPRVRGKHRVLALDEIPDRLIPACAGKTFFWSVLILTLRAHPRVCGENG